MPVRKFSTRLLDVSNCKVAVKEPVAFQGRIREDRLEDFIVAEPALAGEPLLILGRQLREFEEDLDRLDVLAIDQDGEIVLLELKATEDFRVTDLQALAYAAAYANKDNEHFAKAFHAWRHRCDDRITIEEARQAIADFLGLAEFDQWEPSQHVRIKLIAPQFPKRVLATVKWLGDLYGMQVEAIQVRLFETSPEAYQLAFDRLLPLPEADEFDLTVRQRERRRLRANTQSRRPDVVKFLLAHDVLTDGQTLWRDRYDDNDPLFQVRLDANGAVPKFRWRPSADAEDQLLSPSTLPFHVTKAIDPGLDARPRSAVHDKVSIDPGGKSLGQIAEEHGWAGGSDREPIGD